MIIHSIYRNIRRSMSSNVFTNRLADEKSPYLLQHKNNPIDWYPWGEKAFEAARSKNCPIFLSVGYSTCHWCHVMERESFENEEISKLLNENFVSIKVDREERPDVDKLYMSFVVAVNGHGGWPMSVFLNPDLSPITGGTYFPPHDNGAMIGFSSILKLISTKWNDNKESIMEQGKTLIKLLEPEIESGDVFKSEEVINNLFELKKRSFDDKFGGFGRAPKFPKPPDLDFLLFCGSIDSSDRSKLCVHMLKTTLESMICGGIHDHVGKGFHRYSVDAEWHVPHFEKMLYDQSQLLATYSDFHRLTSRNNQEMEKTIRDIFDYMKSISHTSGGFFSAEDADSLPKHDSNKKAEGAFCVWEKQEVESILSGRKIGESNMIDVFCEYFDIEDEGNVSKSADPHNELTNKNIFRRLLTNEECAKNFGLTIPQLLDGIEEGNKLLAKVRNERPKPHLDSKMVTAWQGLSITGMVKAFQACGDESFLESARKCFDFVKRYLLIHETNELRRAVYLGENNEIVFGSDSLRAFSDDYAFLIQGLLDLYTVDGDQDVLENAVKLQTIMDNKFWNGNGYFVNEENDGSGVAVRMVDDQDGVEPCATSVAVHNLLRFYDIFEKEEYREKANLCLRWASKKIYHFPKMAIALDRWQNGSKTFVLVGDPKSSLISEAKSVLNKKFISNVSIVHINSEGDVSATGPSHKEMALGKLPTIYFCKGHVCERPITKIEELVEKIESM